MKNKDFKTVNAHKKDHAVLSDEAEKRGYKMCVMLNKILKKYFPKKYEEE